MERSSRSILMRVARSSGADYSITKFRDAQLLREPPPAAPGSYQPVIVLEDAVRVERLMRWGLVPHWSKDGKPMKGTFNCRAETISEKPSFREPFKKRRCLVEMDSFIEWTTLPTGKRQPYRFFLKSSEAMLVAGLWDAWKGQEPPLLTYTLVTTSPNELVRPLHHRQALILLPEAQERWLDASSSVDVILGLLVPIPGDLMACEPVAALPPTRLRRVKADEDDLFRDA